MNTYKYLTMSLVYTAPSQASTRRNGIYIGGKTDAKSRSKLEQWGVTHILNMTPQKDSSVQVSRFVPHSKSNVLWSYHALLYLLRFDSHAEILRPWGLFYAFVSLCSQEFLITLKRNDASHTNGLQCMMRPQPISNHMHQKLSLSYPKDWIMGVCSCIVRGVFQGPALPLCFI